ncbi:WD40 repeat-like protein [Tricholoma matsutake]|nr:WD40 repeat-like protein [Tricholoma matsutake 945]
MTATVKSDRLKSAGKIALECLRTTLQVAGSVSTSTGVPGLAAGIAGVTVILDAIQQTSDNVESAEKLIMRVEELDKMLQSVIAGEALPRPIIKRVLDLLKQWEIEGEKLKKLQSRSRLRRFIGSKADAQAVAGHLEAIDQSIRRFTLESTFRTEVEVQGLRNDHQAKEVKGLLDGLPHSKAASFDYADKNISRTECMDRTREDILEKIYRWIGTVDGTQASLDDSHSVATSNNARIFWINGMAGTGKTTIAYTVSKHCRDSGIPLATFFCSRDSAETSNPNLVFPTIARQLGIINQDFGNELSKTFMSKPDSVYSALSHQLEMLLVKPLNAARTQLPHCVVVLDALDECKDNSMTSAILSSLSYHITNLPAVRFLITSRPEPNITRGFHPKALQAATESFNLREEALGTVEKDIELYIKGNLVEIRECYELEPTWPSNSDIKSLVGLSEGLFIYAATAVKFVGDTAYDHPKQQLNRLLHNQGGGIGSLTQRLDDLYMQIVEIALRNISPELHDMTKLVLGSIVLLRDPLSALDLQHLLGLEPGTVKRALRRLHSALVVPDQEDRVIRLIHPSFYDFIVDASRCTIPGFLIIPTEHHEVLAQKCFDALLKGLRRDMCDIRDPSKLNSQVDDIQERITLCISPHLQYACRHWMWHLCCSRASEALLEMMGQFVRTKLLYWIEACSLLGELRIALVGLDEVQCWLTTSTTIPEDINELINDCKRLIHESFHTLCTASLHTYYSALVWTPLNSLLRATYEHELVDVVKPLSPICHQWSPCLQTLEAHAVVLSVAFSQDGGKIISGCADYTVRLWDAVTGVLLKVFEGHDEAVFSVAVSADNSMVISGSDDNTVRIWDMTTGALLGILRPNVGCFRCVACSTKKNWIVPSDDDKDIRLWDISTGVLLRTLEGHRGRVLCVAFSPSGEWIVSAAEDHTIRVWHAESGALRVTFEHGHYDSVSAVGFFPDENRILSTSDSCIQIWDMETGSQLLTRTFEHRIVSVACFPLTNEIATGSIGKIYILDAATGSPLRTFEAGFSPLDSLAISHDGKRIASAGKDVQIWQAQAISSEETTWTMDRVIFSPNGSRVVSCTGYRLHVWDALTGTLLATLVGHANLISTISFSADSTQLLSGSHDSTIQLWGVETPIALKTFSGHSSAVLSVGFFNSGARFVSGSLDRTIRIWDTAAGITIQVIEMGNRHKLDSIALSPTASQIAVVVDAVIEIWDSAKGGLQKTFKGHSAEVMKVAFSADGNQIVSGSFDGSIRMWHVASGAEMMVFDNIITAGALLDTLEFSPDQKSIFTNLGPVVIPKMFLSVECQENVGEVPSDSPGYFMRDGWLWIQNPNCRICWIPPAWRPERFMFDKHRLAWQGKRVVFATLDRLVFFDTTDVVDYLKYFY